MRLILRTLGTWLLGIALILLVVDGIRSLGESAVVLTSLAETWGSLHSDSLVAAQDFIASRLLGPVLEQVASAVLALPAWVVIGVPGLLFAWAGRTRRARVFVRQDQI